MLVGDLVTMFGHCPTTEYGSQHYELSLLSLVLSSDDQYPATVQELELLQGSIWRHDDGLVWI